MPISQGGRFSPDNVLVSPGVFTRETDGTQLAQGIANIGGAVVAPFPSGPGFSPVTVNSVSDLQRIFGTPDGVYYGPYTATEYLKQQGSVTVVRAGALTGYQQKYPFVIYAVSGSYGRNIDAGALVSSSSTLSSGGVNYFSSSINTLILTSSLNAVFQPGVAIDSNLSATSTSGSISNAGNVIPSIGTIMISLAGNNLWTGSQAWLSSSLTASSGDVTLALSGYSPTSPSQSYFSSSIQNFTLGTQFIGNGIFAGSTLVNSTITYGAKAGCAVGWTISGVISGSFGALNGTFTSAGNVTADSCGNINTGSANYKVLAVLADTQNATLNSSLQSLGFSGSLMSYSGSVINSTSSSINSDFVLSLQSTNASTPYGNYVFSLNSSSPRYITNVFGDDATAGNPALYVKGTKVEAAYIYNIFEDSIDYVVENNQNWFISGSIIPNNIFAGEPINFTDQYSLNPTAGDSTFALTNAYTPFILSQKVAAFNGGSESRYELFRFHTLSDGTNQNTAVKIEISNVKLAGTVPGSDWGSFTLNVRSYGDTDSRPNILETFQNLTLDPDSSNFIARQIGDRYNYITFAGKVIEFGTYTNDSNYIRVEMTQGNYPITAVPYGFEAYVTPIDSKIGTYVPKMKYSKASVYGLAPGRYASGTVFNDIPVGADAELSSLYPIIGNDVPYRDNSQYFSPLPLNASVGDNKAFGLDDDYEMYGVGIGSFLTGTNAIPSIYDPINEPTYVQMRKFLVGFQGGFDGQSPAVPINVGSNIIPGNTQGLNCTTVNSAGSVAYNQCIAALGNADEFDINLIVTPGIFYQHHPYVCNLVITMCENRGDCFYIMDNVVFPKSNSSVGLINSVVNIANNIDTNYAATYYPWIKILDTNTNDIISVPPSVILPSVFAASDASTAEWFAPAGLTRGGIPQAVQVLDRLTHQERDTLYVGKVNPIAAFPGQGISVWGQKTLQIQDSALNRVNVRRLLIAVKKFIASASNYLVFEQNVTTTRNRFLAIVNPYMESVQQRSGVYAFSVVMDSTNNTSDLIDREILYGQVQLQPVRSAEIVVIDFGLTPTGAIFSN